ncbi:CapA family protein, partial [Hydrogenophaga borbori]
MQAATDTTTVLLAGDLMTGRGVDQAMAHPASPELYEPGVRDARDYLRLAERANGPIPSPVSGRYLWGDALAEVARIAPDASVANLETAVTADGEPWPRKGIHYRMHPDNIACLRSAGLSACALANNHALDWGPAGLLDTQRALARAGVGGGGAGGPPPHPPTTPPSEPWGPRPPP